MTTTAHPTTTGEPTERDLLTRTLHRIDAPDVVLAVTRHGRRTLLSAGSSPTPDSERLASRYELGSLTKTFTGLLLADLCAQGSLRLDDPAIAHLPNLPHHHPGLDTITLGHLITHTSGLPRLPTDLLTGAVLRPRHNSYAHYDTARLLHAFARSRPRHTPGTRWNYSNFGIAILGTALSTAAGTSFPDLVTARVLTPLGLTGTVLAPNSTTADALGHRKDGTTPVPVSPMGAFAPAAAIRATADNILTYLEAHLAPPPGPLAEPLRQVQEPVLRRGLRHRDTHTLTWFHHPAHGGPLLFHAGATFGQQAFAGYHPATATGVAALATRRGNDCRLVPAAYDLLHSLAENASTKHPTV
ncbi:MULTISPECIES: serine hydrolase domain-containing protein [unclassified Streptomyces]|uniref:serine hydrolase domain-containing protein n=1 Tax=unclassified Streptomyces TaxID=2593676 RepID=UPI000DBAA15C|nr:MULTISPECIES: serine hydrolase domain-containing protein [unclassified Streptomyces]MYT69772.1 serine hydrolase [Streptomyces sp. SID8367]RAJ70404.1 CubicO group peptidase (beta-lactamase class C family) [Streptomyces sp. PsTaAH-137]